MFHSKNSKVKFVPKGWGYEKWIVNKPEYCGKLLFFAAGYKCSVHYHKVKDETFYIQSGKVIIRFTDELEKFLSINTDSNYYSGLGVSQDKVNFLETIVLEQGQSFHVPPGRVHQIEAIEDTELYEFSTEHKEEDSYKITKGD